MLANASLMAVLQTVIAQDFQGRAISVLTTMNAVAAPVGLAIANPLGEFLGVSWLFFRFWPFRRFCDDQRLSVWIRQAA